MPGYRDEREALYARAEALEADLAGAREEFERTRGQLDEARAGARTEVEQARRDLEAKLSRTQEELDKTRRRLEDARAVAQEDLARVRRELDEARVRRELDEARVPGGQPAESQRQDVETHAAGRAADSTAAASAEVTVKLIEVVAYALGGVFFGFLFGLPLVGLVNHLAAWSEGDARGLLAGPIIGLVIGTSLGFLRYRNARARRSLEERP